MYGEEEVARARHIKRLRDMQGPNLSAIRNMLVGPTPEAGSAASVDDHLGQRLFDLRRRQKLSLRQVSARTGLAASFISLLEQTSKGSSLVSLKKLARCYGVTVTSLTVPPRPEEKRVVRAGARRILPTLGSGITIEQLAEGSLQMDCQRWILMSGAGSSGGYSHRGEEFILVLEGHFEIVLDGRHRYALGPGDSIYFKSSSTHAWRNPGPDQTVLIWVNTPPTF
jgi:transcriptional regulator with XRE-family HTH domain